MALRNIMIYSRFERFWHWTQALLIFALLFSGMAIRGMHEAIPFGAAVTVHTVCALALIVLWLFAIFWHFTTGAWRHYVPTAQGLGRVARYYAYGIFRGERHPYRKAFWRKHNPLQALTYLALKLVLFPAVWLTGLAYLLYAFWEHYPWAGDALPWVAAVHTLAAFAILAFVIAHVYLLTTGGSFRHHVRPMVTGYDRVELTPTEERYFEESHTVDMK
ncbi:cytochrome b/b6 domain-containing protein [Wenzhouxiangella sp. EGI_FJ10305]|uniref:cytochrome b/b6 domain-containing protein n=1 Tax=Wenzhouxiangella sp. EGI_FJ10305 TaxID=3243768 RepID=UPI0035DA47ED